MESLWIKVWVTSKDLNAQRVDGKWGFLQYKLNWQNQYEIQTYHYSGTLFSRRYISWTNPCYTYFNEKG